MANKIIIELEIEGNTEDALQAVKLALDGGVLQDEINDYDTDGRLPLEVTSATSKFVGA
jgi:hypothetical protein